MIGSAPQRRGGPREMARQAFKDEVSRFTFDLAIEKGYAATTVDDVCAAANISRSTFFRYFRSKEDSLFGATMDAGAELAVALSDRPQGEPVWTSLRLTLDPLIQRYAGEAERARQLMQLVIETPALSAVHREKQANWLAFLRPEVSRRLGLDPEDHSDPRAAALIGATFACLDAALAAWTSAAVQNSAIADLVDEAMGLISLVDTPSQRALPLRPRAGQ